MTKKIWLFCIITFIGGIVGGILMKGVIQPQTEKSPDYNQLSPGALLDVQLNLEKEISGLNNERIVVEQMKLDKINQVRGIETPTTPIDQLTEGLNLK